MKILYVSSHYYPYIGGVEYVVKSVAERLVKEGHEVIVLSGEPKAKKVREEELNGVHIIRWPTWAPNDAYHIPLRRSDLVKLVGDLAKEVSVIHVHSAHSMLPVFVGITAKKLYPSVRLVFTLHYHRQGHTLLRRLAWTLLWRRYVRELIRYSDKIHAVSNVEAERVVEDYPETSSKLTIIPNGVEEDVLQYKWNGQDSDYIMYAGRIEKYKNLEAAVDLVAALNAHGYNLRLIIIGQGPHKSRIEKYARGKAPSKVEFLPLLPRREYLKHIARARATVNPSRHEAYSIFIAESLAIGTPAIVSKEIEKIFSARVERLSLDSLLDIVLKQTRLVIITNTIVENKVQTWSKIILDYFHKLYET